jgi:hypothetical protein
LQEKVGDQMLVHIDLIDREHLKTDPASFFAGNLPEDNDSENFAELVSPLVIEPDGSVVPIQYGFAMSYGLGNLHEASLSELMQRWRREKLPEFRDLCRRVYQTATKPADLPFFNWYEVLGEMAENNADNIPQLV